MGTAVDLLRTGATLACAPKSTAEGVGRFVNVLARRLDSNFIRAQTPMSNTELYRATGRSPLEWTGGIGTTEGHHRYDLLAWQQRGVPCYVTNTGHGLNPAETNARTIRDNILRHMDETGADGVHTGAQSKGTIDLTLALLRYPELLPHVKSVSYFAGPFDGGFTTSPAKAQALRGIVEFIDRRLPENAKGWFQAGHELTHGSPLLSEIREGFPELVARLPEGTHITNYVSHLKGTQFGGRPGHDLFIPKDSQQLPAYDAALEGARRIEVVDLGTHNHVTTHQYRPAVEHMDRKMFELDNGLSQDWRRS